MNRRYLERGLRAALVGCLLVGGLSCRRGPAEAGLPALASYPDLPAHFTRELELRRERVLTARTLDPDAVRNLARLYHANRLFDEALACYDVIASESARWSARDHYYLGDLARNRNDLSRARAEWEAVVALQPDYLPARLALADSLFKTGQEDAAAEAYRAVLALAPGQPQASLALARLELQRGDETAAVDRLEDLMAARPDFAGGAALLAQILRRRGETDRATAWVEMSQQRPDAGLADPWLDELQEDLYDLRLLGLLAEDSLRAGRIERGRFFLRRIEEIDPGSPLPSLLQGQTAALLRRHEAAVTHYREALEKGGDPEAICPSLTASLLSLDRAEDAVALMADHYRRRPDSQAIAQAYADALMQQGDHAAARPVLEQVLQKEPRLRAQNMALARILWEAGERDAAAGYLQRVADAFGDDIPSRALLGEYHLDRSEPLTAIPLLEQALAEAERESPAGIRLSGLLGLACLQAGQAAVAQGRPAEAVDHFAKASRVVPDDPNAHAALASLAVQQGDFARAAAALRRLSALQPKNPTILLSLGDVLRYQGDLETAQRHWRQALEQVAPGDDGLRRALEARLRGEFDEGERR